MVVGGKIECGGSEISKGKQPSLNECATQCKRTASMFIFGTNDYGTTRCNDEGCECYCETSATPEGLCDQVPHNGYRLYKYLTKGNILMCNN